MKIVGLTDKNEYKEDYRRLKAHDERYPGIAEVAKHPAAKRPFIPDVAVDRTDVPEICHRDVETEEYHSSDSLLRQYERENKYLKSRLSKADANCDDLMMAVQQLEEKAKLDAWTSVGRPTDSGSKYLDLIIVDDDHPGPYLAIGEVVNMDEHGGTLVNYSPDKKAVRGTIDPETVKAWKPLEVPEEFNSEFLYVLVIYDENRKYVESSICSTMLNANKKGIDMTHAYPGWTYRIITEKL